MVIDSGLDHQHGNTSSKNEEVSVRSSMNVQSSSNLKKQFSILLCKIYLYQSLQDSQDTNFQTCLIENSTIFQV